MLSKSYVGNVGNCGRCFKSLAVNAAQIIGNYCIDYCIQIFFLKVQNHYPQLPANSYNPCRAYVLTRAITLKIITLTTTFITRNCPTNLLRYTK